MTTNLYAASKQWATRPQDERFMTLREMYEATRGYYETAVETDANYADLRVVADGEEVRIEGGNTWHSARLTNWSFGQLVYYTVPQNPWRVGKYLRTLPATLAAQNINYGLKSKAGTIPVTKSKGIARLLFHGGNSDVVLRAMTSSVYSRFWNWELVVRLQDLNGWYVPPAMAVSPDPRNHPATSEELAPFGNTTTVRAGDMIGPAGLYASDHDMFGFLVRPDRTIKAGPNRYLSRGAFFWNSEVGSKSLGIQTFLYDYTCANHIVWDVEDVRELRIAHVGEAERVKTFFSEASERLLEYSNESVAEQETQLRIAQTIRIGRTFDEVIDVLASKVTVSRKALRAAYALCEANEDGDPLTFWGMTAGLTRLSQSVRGDFADRRLDLDREAGKVLQLAFS